MFKSRILSIPWFLLFPIPSSACFFICRVQCLVYKTVGKGVDGFEEGPWRSSSCVVAVITVADKDTMEERERAAMLESGG